jgi:cell wall-associated NlpC family hydrolase
MKRLTTIAFALVVVVIGGNYPETPADAETLTPNSVKVIADETKPKSFFEKVVNGDTSTTLTFLEVAAHEKRTLLEQAAEEQAQRVQNTLEMRKTLKALRKTAGRTWYVFSGVTPQGWDCSGLVYWTYQQLGITLEHSATAQSKAGTRTANPQPGDIVAFHHGKSKSSFHTGIYLGDGKFIHAYRHGMRTVIDSVAEVSEGNGNARVTYTRIIDQEPSLP